jgi:Holliday junction resolvasome RuvABC endonuclease subunit
VTRVIGLDQSYTGFGYCVDGESKKKAFPATKFADPIARLDAVRTWIEDWLTAQRDHSSVDLVVMEGYANGAKFGRELAGELGGVVKLAVVDCLGMSPLIVPPTSLKKFVAGSGNAKKNTMIAHVYKKWGVMFSDDNQADAFALERFGHGYLWITQCKVAPRGREVSYTKYEIEAIEAVRKAK